MFTKAVIIQLVPSKGCLEVTGEKNETYVLWPKRRAYYDLVELVAEKQKASNGQAVDSSEVARFIEEVLRRRRKILLGSPTEAKSYGAIEKLSSFHTCWVQKFCLPKTGYWNVMDADGKDTGATWAQRILRAVFKWQGSGINAQYRLGDRPEVQILLETQLHPYDHRNVGQDWRQFVDYCRDIVQGTISRLGHKYDSQLYIKRKETERQFEGFLRSPQNLFLLTGKAGTGKTNLMCHLAEVYSPCLFFSGDLYRTGCFSLKQEVDKHLESLWHRDTDMPDLTGYVHHLTSENKKAFVLFVDATNEFSNPVPVLQELADISVRWGTLYPTIKLCVSCRTPSWESLERSAQVLLPCQNLYVPNVEIRAESMPGEISAKTMTLEDFEKDEFEEAQERYRQRMAFTGSLSYDHHEACRRPLLLKLVTQIWSGKQVPEHTNVRELWDDYWRMMVSLGPGETEDLALELASFMRRQQKAEITEDKARYLQYYSAQRLHYLVDTGVLNLSESTYERKYSFAHERLLEYALARTLLKDQTAVLKDVGKLVSESEEFSNLHDAIVFFAGTVDANLRWQLFQALITLGEEGQKLVCEVIEEFRLKSYESWEILDSLTEGAEVWAASALGEIGDSNPERARVLLTKVIEKDRYWSFTTSESFGRSLDRLCRKSEFFVQLAEKYLSMETRYKQVALLVLTTLDDYPRWDMLQSAIKTFARSRDANLRQAAAQTLRDLARRNSDATGELVKVLAGDAKKEVRDKLGYQIAGLIYDGSAELTEVLSSIAKSPSWRARQTAAIAIGYNIEHIHQPNVDTLAKQLAGDPNGQVRMSLLDKTLICFRSTRDALETKTIRLLETIVLRLSWRDLDTWYCGYAHRSFVSDLIAPWSGSDRCKLRAFAATIWRRDIGDNAMYVASALCSDRSARVRLAMSRRLRKYPTAYEVGCEEQKVLHLLRGLLKDPDHCVRRDACLTVSTICTRGAEKDESRNEGISMLMDRLAKEDDEHTQWEIIMSLINLGTLDQPRFCRLVDERLPGCRDRGILTRMASGIGSSIAESKAASNFVCAAAQKPSEAHQQLAAVALLVACLENPKRSHQYSRILSASVQHYPCRSHFMVPALLGDWAGTEVGDQLVTENAHDVIELLRASFSCKHILVRLWTVFAAARCLAFHQTSLNSLTDILRMAARAQEWELRFACGLYSSWLITEGKRDPSCASLAQELCLELSNYPHHLVAQAAAFSLAQIRKNARKAWLDKFTGHVGTADIKGLMRIYAIGKTEKHIRDLLAQLYCLNFGWVSEQLAYEIDALEQDWSEQLLAIWRLKPEETESLLKTWRNHESTGLRGTAKGFFRKLQRARKSEKRPGILPY